VFRLLPLIARCCRRNARCTDDDIHDAHKACIVQNWSSVTLTWINTGRKPGTGCAHSKIARVVFVLYVVGRAY